MFPLSLSQHRLWLLEQFARHSPYLNAYRSWRLTGELDVEALQRAMKNLVKRHQVLRTRFRVINGEPFQDFDSDRDCPVTMMDMTQLPASERESRARALVNEAVKQPFNLEQGPVLRVLLLRMAEQEHIFLLNLDHLVVDGWSMGILLRETGQLYEAAINGKPSPLVPPAMQYSDYCSWQRQRLQTEMVQDSLRYWVQLLTAAPVLQLPTDRPRPQQSTHAGARLTFVLPATLTQQLKDVSQQHRVTLFMTLLAMFKVLLRSLSGQNDLLVGTPVATRHHRELESIAGLMVNHLPIRTELGDKPGFSDVLDCVREATLEAFSHQDVPFAAIVNALDITPEPDRHPLFQVFFTLQNAPNREFDLPGLHVEPDLTGSVGPFSNGNDTAKFDLALSMVDVHGSLHGDFEYSTDLFEQSTIAAMRDSYLLGLRRIAENPGLPVSGLLQPKN